MIEGKLGGCNYGVVYIMCNDDKNFSDSTEPFFSESH